MEEQERTITLDLGSSPDPLIDPVLSPPMMPPSTIKKRTPAAERLLTARTAQSVRTAYASSAAARTPLAPTPRRQTFELDVGDEDAPQRLLVTVEAEADPRSAPRSTSRRLFQSPTPKNGRLSPRRTAAVTTTTVPLRGLSDDEDDAAPRPIGTTPRPRGRPRKSATPATTRRKRPGTPAKRATSVANAPTSSPSKNGPESDAGFFEATPRPRAKPTKRKASSPIKEDAAPGSQPRKRGRPRKKTMDTDEAAEQARQSRFVSTAEEDDIWLSTMLDQSTPALPARGPPVATESHTSPLRGSEPGSYDWPDMGAGGGDSYSDGGSVSGDGDGFEDTVMAEEFTMISLGSLPSMQPNSSVMAPAHDEELGEATSLIINGALESLRRSQNAMSEQPRHPEHAAEAETSERAAATAATQAPTPNDSRTQPPRLAPPSSPQRRRQSPQRSPRRSPRKTAPQPLARRLAEKTLQQQQQQQQDPEHPPEPQPPVQNERQEASAYDDSFSSIPEAILAAATPRPLRQLFRAQEPDARIQPSVERPSKTPSPIPSETGDDGHHDHDQDHHDTHNANRDPEPEPEHEPEPGPEPPKADAPETDHLPSSPPPVANAQLRIANLTAPQQQQHHHQQQQPQHIRHNSTETPADQLSWFPSANPAARVVRDAQPAAAAHLPVPEPQPRPSLSPIVRAGRALQLITSDPPSPPAGDSFLGSPFRGSSVPKSSQSPVPMPAVPEHDRPYHSPDSASATAGAATAAAAASAAAAAAQPRADVLTRSPSRSWLAPLNQVKDFIVRSAQSLSPGRMSVVSGAEGMDDPFGPDPGEAGGERSARNTLFTGARRQSWGERSREEARDGDDVKGGMHDHDDGQRQEEAEEEVVVEDDDDTMSWEAEQSPARAQPAEGIDEVVHGVAQESPREPSRGYEAQTRWPASGFSPGASRPLAGSAAPEEAHGGVHEEQQQQQQHHHNQEEVEEEEEDDVDIWAIEAQRPTPYTSRHAPFSLEPDVEPPQQPTISGLWGRDRRNPRYGDELVEPSDAAAPVHGRVAVEENQGTKPSPIQVRPLRQRPLLRPDRSLLANDEEEFSLLSQNHRRDKPVPSPAVARPAAPKKDLAAFFSSPATLPDLTEPPFPANVLPSQPARTSRVQTLRAQATGGGGGLFSQYLEERAEKQVPSVPQKTLEIGTGRRSVDLFSTRRQSVERPSLEVERASLSRSASTEVPELRPAPANQNPVAVAQQHGVAKRATSLESPDQHEEEAEEQEVMSPPHIPQKMNFTPRKRSGENTLLSPPKPADPAPAPTTSLFGNSQVTAFFSRALSRVKQRHQPPQVVDSSPPARAAEAPEEDRRAETENDVTQASTPPRRVLKPLPDRTASPTKSSFRSPLKPKTPGRVVEFASSVFSQPQQRQEEHQHQRRHQRQGWDEEEEDEGPGRQPAGRRVGHGDVQDVSPAPSPSPSASPSLSMSSPSTPPSPSPSPSPSSRPRARSRSGSLPAARAEAAHREQHDHLADQHEHEQDKQAHTQPPSILPQQPLLPRPLKPGPSHKDKPRKTVHQPLSPTSWTRAHWLRLDELLQARRRGPASFRIELARGPLPPSSLYSLSPFRARRGQEEDGPGGWLARRLVGKQVSAHGFSETLTLEGWHVEVVEGFLREVRHYGEGEGEDCAWNGVDLARRVFALLVGAERRRLGLVPLVRDMTAR
ncbi:hypothetical protein VTJ83DRAFT_6637 [Remersonia thermophila]|uniref:Uncharacterized protein n=1 Tax=Remersonia thermophila TaxID=72144 RepID=A0ABR4D5A2_9PEZI